MRVLDYSEETQNAEYRKMVCSAVVFAVAICLLFFHATVAICAAIWRKRPACTVFTALTALCVCALVLAHALCKPKSDRELYKLSSVQAAPEQVFPYFHAERLEDGFYRSTTLRNGIFCTMDFFCADTFNAQSREELRSAAKKHAAESQRNVPLYSGGKYARMDFILCKEAEPAMLGWIAANARNNINRTESLFYAVLCTQEKTLYFPRVFDAMEYLKVKRYRQFCETVSELSKLGDKEASSKD